MNRLAAVLEWPIVTLGRVGVWFVVPLVLVTLFDVVMRRYFVIGSTGLQEAEWHFHTLLLMSCFGYVYVLDQMVRVDIFRERMMRRTQLWTELFACLCLGLPFCLLTVGYGIFFACQAFESGEGSMSSQGIQHRWLIKSTLPLGMLLLGLAIVARVLRCIDGLRRRSA